MKKINLSFILIILLNSIEIFPQKSSSTITGQVLDNEVMLYSVSFTFMYLNFPHS
jgi:glycopeptide antibiotics resistance protein